MRDLETASHGVTVFRYDAFISYRHVEPDRTWARWIHRALESYRAPRAVVKAGAARRVSRLFRDEEEVEASASLSDAIDSALVDSKWLIVVCSPRTPESAWVDKEIRRFHELGRADRILALLIEGSPAESFPRSMSSSGVPLIVRTESGESSAGPTEPLAADVRAVAAESLRTRRKRAKLRLLSTLLGCRYDDLARREHERRSRRIASTLGTLAGAGVLVAATLAAKNHELRVANRRVWAARESMAGVTFELRDDLKALNRIDLLERVARRMTEYYRERGEDTLDDIDRRDRLAYREILGDVELTVRSNAAAGEAIFRGALDDARGLLSRAGESTRESALRDVGVAASKLGQAVALGNRHDEAILLFREAERVARELIIMAPAKVQYRQDLGEWLVSLAESQGAANDSAGAGASLDDAIRLLDASEASATPDARPALLRVLATAHGQRASMAMAKGAARAALACCDEVDRVIKRLRPEDLVMPAIERLLVRLHLARSELERSNGSLVNSLAEIDLALGVSRPAHLRSPQQADGLIELAMLLNRRVIALSALQRTDDALAAAHESVALVEGVPPGVRTSAVRVELARARFKLGDTIAMAKGASADARAPIDAAIGDLEALRREGDVSDNAANVLSYGYEALGRLLDRPPSRGAAIAPYLASVAIQRTRLGRSLEPKAAVLHDLAARLANLGDAMVASGRIEEGVRALAEAVGILDALAAANPAFVADRNEVKRMHQHAVNLLPK